jgi:TonB-linked SusC/RagA family outer membrane protein
MKFASYLMSCWLLFMFAQTTFAQTRPPLQLQFVHQQTLEPLANVTILLNGQPAGSSDVNGAATINNIKEKDKLTFSHIGFELASWEADNRATYTVAMIPLPNQMEQVVVIGYGVQKKSNVTTAISSIKAEQLENMPVVRVENSLQGRISGVNITTASGQPGAPATVRVRGITTIGNSNPLYIVDGVQIEGGIEFLNQADIASIEVMKDAAAASIYGARGANGVILVTTKRGVKGKTSVNYNGYQATQAPWKKLDLLNAREYATLVNEAHAASNLGLRFPDVASLGEGTDWQKEIFNDNAKMRNHELSLASGGEKSTYFTSFGYFQQDGIVATSNSQFERITFRFNSTHKITDRIEFGNNIGYTRIQSVGVGTNSEWGSPLNRAINIDPITPVVERDPAKYNMAPYNNPNIIKTPGGFPYGISGLVTSEILNPVAALQTNETINFSDKIVANAYIDAEILKGLKFRSSIGADLAFWGTETFLPVFYLNATNQRVRNQYTRESNRGLFWLWENTLSYQTTLNNHSFTVLAGTSAQKNKGLTQAGAVDNIPVTRLKDASLGFNVPRADRNFWGGEYLNTLSSLFGRFIYSYEDKYLLSATVRRDGSSRFGSNNKYGVFPSVSAGWILSRESFFESVTPIQFLKLRGSWAVAGNDRIADFQYLATVGSGRDYTFGMPSAIFTGVSPNRLSNPDLKWEETSQLNIGMDIQFLRHFNASIDWFHKKTSDMLLEIAVPAFVGNAGPIGNIATLENRGFEFELGYNQQIGEVQLSLNGNFSTIQNKITYLGDDKEFLPGQTYGPQGLEITRTQIGHAFGSFFGLRTDGIFQNQQEVDNYKDKDGNVIQPNAKPGDLRFVDLNGDGIIDNNDRTIMGNPTPKFTYGFTAQAKWRSFDLMVFGQGIQGNDVMNLIRRFDLPMANWTKHALNRWIGEGSTNEHPRMTISDPNKNYSQSSDFFLEDGSYFRIKTIQLGYQLPQSITRKAGIQKARVYVMANNLLTFTKYRGFDPEIGGDSFGVDRGIYPQPRAFFVGLNLGF